MWERKTNIVYIHYQLTIIAEVEPCYAPKSDIREFRVPREGNGIERLASVAVA